MMSENLLSVFKKELGYVNDTNQYVELSIRITEKEHSLDLRNNLQGLAQSVNLNVSTLTEDYMCRISKSYIVNIHSCLENFLKSFKHLPGSPTNITEIKKTSEDDWLEWTLNMAFSSIENDIKNDIGICEYYRLVRNCIVHSGESSSTLKSKRALIKTTDNPRLNAPNGLDSLTFDDQVLFSRAAYNVAKYIFNNSQYYELIKCAFDDHFAERYHTSVPLFLIIIDGAVNDYTKSKGFFAEGTDVSAWDCLVGCGDGLTKIKDIFKKGRNKTNHDEIRLPYRNGILHGRDLNYANKYVSCKCISLMFALADWMNMKDSENTRKQKFEKECNPPPISESLKKIKQNAIDRQEIQKWVKRDIKIGETISATPTIEECKDFPYLLPLISAFNAWSTRNYGSLSVWFKNVFSYESSDKKRAGECRKLFDHKNLISYELEEIEERALALTKIVVLVKWKSNDIVHTEHFEFGCSYQQEDGNVGYPWKNNGAWILIPWKIQGLYK